MGSIERRVFVKGATMGVLACAVEGAQVLFTAGDARAQAPAAIVSPWPNRRLLDLLRLDHPIVQAPMAGYVGSEMAVAVATVGGLGSLPCGLLTPLQVRDEFAKIRARTTRPINLNFFCHQLKANEAAETAWRKRLAPYYVELGLDPTAPITPLPLRRPFDADMCDVVVELKPEIVSFLFGLPEAAS